MLKDIYAIPEEEPRYKDNVLEVTGELDEIIQQVDMILFTNKGDVDVKFVKWDFNVAMIVGLLIGNKKVASYLV